jgi:hypothetical protein
MGDAVGAEKDRPAVEQLHAFDDNMKYSAIDEVVERVKKSIDYIDCNCCRKERGMPPIKHGFRGTCKKHLKNIPSDVRDHAAGLVPGCNCMACPKRPPNISHSYMGLAPFN